MRAARNAGPRRVVRVAHSLVLTMLLYEVTLEVEASIADAFRDWLETHAGEMLDIDGFEQAEIFEAEAPGNAQVFVAHYRVASQAALDRYVAEDAPRMRGDGVARFGEKMKATRRVLRLHRSFRR